MKGFWDKSLKEELIFSYHVWFIIFIYYIKRLNDINYNEGGNMIYVALLRGINVGGNNKIEMKKLKITFETLGFKNVVTYINSGNIIFEDVLKKQDIIVSEIETGIKQDFGLEIKVLVRNFNNIENICKTLPDNWLKNEIMRTDIMFLWEDINNSEIISELQISPVDNVKFISGAVLWNIELKNYNKSSMSKLVVLMVRYQ